ncbi:hypothetical protein EWB00_000327, partial [Schistosoma japonicum]
KCQPGNNVHNCNDDLHIYYVLLEHFPSLPSSPLHTHTHTRAEHFIECSTYSCPFS